MRDFYEELARLLETNPTLAIATVIATEGSTPREASAKMVVLPDGRTRGSIGGGGLEKIVTEEAVRAIARGESVTREYDLKEEELGGIGALCGGRATVYIEVIKPADRLLMVGGGHIAKALAPMAAMAGMSVVVADERREFATRERFPAAEKVLVLSPSDPALRGFVTPSTYVVIFTHAHEKDKEALRNLVGSGARYVGVIGSRRKAREVLDELGREGVARELLDEVHTPVGIDIGAETPAEIAVSILAEIIHVRRKGNTSPASLKLPAKRASGLEPAGEKIPEGKNPEEREGIEK